MKTYVCKGFSAYEYFVVCDWGEMQRVVEHFNIDPNFFRTGPAKTLVMEGEESFFYFVSVTRKRIALMPFLSVAFGGMYNSETPIGGETALTLDLNDYGLEKFRFS